MFSAADRHRQADLAQEARETLTLQERLQLTQRSNSEVFRAERAYSESLNDLLTNLILSNGVSDGEARKTLIVHDITERLNAGCVKEAGIFKLEICRDEMRQCTRYTIVDTRLQEYLNAKKHQKAYTDKSDNVGNVLNDSDSGH